MKPPIRLIIGLGNPGPQYEATRHNAGFWLADHLADDFQTSFTLEKPIKTWVAKGRFESSLIVIAKPAAFMNRSGLPCASLMQFYKLTPPEVLVIHDEVDLMPGQAKLKQGGGHAGHNGLRDIQSALSSADFWRLRVGVGHPRTLGLDQQVAAFVLSSPRRDELTQIEAVIDRCRAIVPALLRAEYDQAIQQLHGGNSA